MPSCHPFQARFTEPRRSSCLIPHPLHALRSRWTLVIWSGAMTEITSCPISPGRGSQCLAGSNEMSCFPLGPLMPLWASFCRSLLCHSEIIAQDSNALVDLEITERQQVSPLSPVRPGWGNPGVGWYRDVFLCLCLSLSFACFLTAVVHKCSQLLAPPHS